MATVAWLPLHGYRCIATVDVDYMQNNGLHRVYRLICILQDIVTFVDSPVKRFFLSCFLRSFTLQDRDCCACRV